MFSKIGTLLVQKKMIAMSFIFIGFPNLYLVPLAILLISDEQLKKDYPFGSFFLQSFWVPLRQSSLAPEQLRSKPATKRRLK